MLGQFAPGRGIDGVAELLAADGGGADLQLGGQALLFRQILEDELGHRAAADVAVANE